ncbi:MAG: hypothetical protein A3C44_05825 [Gammaproteobacteria bacterium RIFCSPHIGHO2_02_FULL_39_13]|nr:MAG: hypothetical protein A3C44_05825 [Gammaproteobacteria bacterium RIFCSPHIGHO2_02_FULL_39_13]OGT49322.1 MAG: hypothetical protein A3E53_07715 [Gammaproteobacteria bacterium RIFCSPHIGHO2_12_FULL_39_24]
MKFLRILKRLAIFIFPLSVLIFSANSFAGAFQLWEQDAGGVGDYHAGGAAEADTAATIFYNPASATHLQHQQLSFGAALIGLQVKFSGTADGIPVTNEAGDTTNIVPNFSYALPFANRWAFAFSMTSPFGLSTVYSDTLYVNTLATTTELETVNLNPSLAYQINRYLSLGAGFDALYGKAIYDSDIFSPLDSELTGWNYGYNAGVLLQFTPATRAGVSYRSAITIDAKGSSTAQSYDVPPLNLQSNASAKFPLPATTIFSVYHDFNSRLTLMASAFYTQWSVFKQLIINNVATPNGPGVIAINENYRDTWNLSLGGKYHFNRHIALDAGLGHDETPTRMYYRDIRLPDNNHYAASLGLDIQPSPGFKWSMGWTHFFVPSTPIDNTLSNDASKTTTVLPPTIGLGTVDGSVNVYGIQLTCDI